MARTENRLAVEPGSRSSEPETGDDTAGHSSKYQAAVVELGQLALESSSLATLYKIVSTRLAELLSVNRVGIMEVEDDCCLKLVAGYGWSARQFGATVVEWAEIAPNAYPSILRGPIVDESPETPPLASGIVPPNTPGVLSAQTVPVGRMGAPVGAIGVYSSHRRRFTSDELALLKSVAQIVASAIERARTDERIRQHSTETTILGEIARIIGSSLEIDEVYPLFVEQVARLLHFDRITISTIDLVNNTQVSTYWAGVEVPKWVGPPAKIDGRAVEAAVRARSGMIIQDENLADFQRSYPVLDIGQSAGLRSMLTMPVIWNGEVINMLTLRSRSVNAYKQRDLHVAERIAAQIAGALANSKLHHERMAFAEEQATLAEISRIIASSARIDEIYPRFATAVRKLIPFDRITITTINEEFSQVMSRYAWGKDFPGSTVLVNRPLEGTLTAAVARVRAGMTVSAETILNGSKDFTYLEAGLKAGLKSAMGMPLIFRGRVIGALLLRSTRANAYSSRELSLAERVATQISGIVWNAQLQEQLEQTVRKQVLMAELGTEMLKAQDVTTVCERVHQKVSQCIQFDRFALGMFDAEHSRLKYEFVRGIAVKGFNQGSIVYRPVGGSSALWSELMSSHIGNNQREGVDPEGFIAAFNETTLVSWLQVPLRYNGQIIGILSLRSTRPNAYSRSDLLMLERVAEQMALAIENVKSHRRAQQLNLKHSMMEAMIAAGSRHSEPRELLHELIKHIRASIPGDCMVMTCLDSAYEETAREINAASPGGHLSRAELLELNRLVVTAIVNSHAPLLLSEDSVSRVAGASESRLRQALNRAGYCSSLSVPLMRRGAIVGVLHFHSSSPDLYSDHYTGMAEQSGALLVSAMTPAESVRQPFATTLTQPPVNNGVDVSPKCTLARHQLNENDIEILKALASGFTNNEIAERLNFAPGTIKNRLARIYKIFDVPDRAAAMAFAIRCGIVD